MSLLIKAGISKLSELEIDANKDWQAKEITNLKAIAAAMARGDIVFRGDDILERLAGNYGVGYNFLHMKNAGQLQPEWMDIQELIVYLTGALNRMIAPPVLAIPTPAMGLAVAEDHSGGGYVGQGTLSIPEPGIDLETATGPGGGVTAEKTLNIPAPSISEELATNHPVGGAVADDGGVQTDETAVVNSPTANDMILLPATPAVNDAYYFGYSALWDWLRLNIGTAGAGTWTIVWEYWNGTAWTGLPDISDGTSHFGNAGINEVTFTRPGDWATTDVGSILGLYWIRARVSAYTSITTQPLGTQAWIWVKH